MQILCRLQARRRKKCGFGEFLGGEEGLEHVGRLVVPGLYGVDGVFGLVVHGPEAVFYMFIKG